MKEFDYSQVKHYKLYNFIKTIFRPLVKFVFKMQFKGLENIPSEGTRYIVAINHTCALDPVFAACPKQLPPLHFMAKVELFKNPIVGWFMTHMYGFPVKRGKGDNSAIEYGEKIINEELRIKTVFPKGLSQVLPLSLKQQTHLYCRLPFAVTVRLKQASMSQFPTASLLPPRICDLIKRISVRTI